MSTNETFETIISSNNSLIKGNVPKVFEAGKAQGGGGDITQNPMYYMSLGYGTWLNKVFPDGFEFVLALRDMPAEMNAMLMRTKGIKTVTLVCETEGTNNWAQVLRECPTEILDITNFKPRPTNISYLVYGAGNLVSILGELDLSICTTATLPFSGAKALQEIRFKEGTISISLSFADCKNLSAESYDSIIKGYSKEANVTLTLPSEETVRSVFDTKYGSGAWDTITAEYSNLTISYM